MVRTNTVDRQKRIVEILTLLHEGTGTEEENFEEAKRLFNAEFDDVDVSEITGAEKALIQGGLNPAEIQKLCNIHAAVFKGNIREVHGFQFENVKPGHPAHTLKLENKVLTSLMEDKIKPLFALIEAGDWSQREVLLAALRDLSVIDTHYIRKETLLFSFMERYGITAPPKVMWGVDDAVREMLKDLIDYLSTDKAALNTLRDKIDDALSEIEEMIFKEEAILLPMCLDVFSLADWQQIEEDSAEIGYCLIAAPLLWLPSEEALKIEAGREPLRQAKIAEAKEMTEGIAESLEAGDETAIGRRERHYGWEKEVSDGEIVLPTGLMRVNELAALFNALPVDLSYVDKNDVVRFYSGGERIFPRAKSVIGRRVIDCHPPKSLDKVQRILDDFRAGTRTHADFWIHLTKLDKFVYIRYFAMTDEETGEYLGCLEVSQEITEIQALTGEKRLDDEV